MHSIIPPISLYPPKLMAITMSPTNPSNNILNPNHLKIYSPHTSPRTNPPTWVSAPNSTNETKKLVKSYPKMIEMIYVWKETMFLIIKDSIPLPNWTSMQCFMQWTNCRVMKRRRTKHWRIFSKREATTKWVNKKINAKFNSLLPIPTKKLYFKSETNQELVLVSQL